MYQALQCEQLLGKDNKYSFDEVQERKKKLRADKKKKRDIDKLKEEVVVQIGKMPQKLGDQNLMNEKEPDKID